MKYTLNFSMKLEKDGSYIVYNPQEFTEQPILISFPDIVSTFERFIAKFEEVGIVDNLPIQKAQNDKKNRRDKVRSQKQLPEQKSINKSITLKGLSGRAYICKSKDLDENVLNQFCSELTDYIHKFGSELSSKTFLSKEISFSGLREVIELRSYLVKYTKDKQIANGYLYVMVM